MVEEGQGIDKGQLPHTNPSISLSEKTYLLRKEIKRRLGEQRMLLPEVGGYLIPDEGEQTLKFQQDQLKKLLPFANVHNVTQC